MKTRHHPGQQAMSLVIVLSVLVVLSALVVALTIAMRMERQAAHYFVQRSSADLLAREGVESAKAAIREATVGADLLWVTMPGAIYSATNSFAAGGGRMVALHSGFASPSDTEAPDLDRLVRSDDSLTLITGSTTQSNPMRVAWVYVRQDGSREYTSTPNTNNKANPIVGRFAYWADDESARLDLNTAWKRSGNTNSVNHPTKVNLLAIPGLSEAMADTIHEVATNTAFNSPDEARRIPSIAGLVSSNRFSLSHYAFSSTLNPWGNPKIYLTTSSNNLPEEVRTRTDYTNYFLDVRDNNADPGIYAGMNSAKVLQQLARLQSLLGTNQFPYSTDTFASKYSALTRAQIALDILEYVRSAESTNKVVFPLRVRYDTAAGAFTFSGVTGATDDILVGSSRRPMFTEIAIKGGPLTTNNLTQKLQIAYEVQLEVCIPKSYGLSVADLAGGRIGVSSYYPSVLTNASETWGPGIATATIGSDSSIQANEDDKYIYLVVKQSVTKTSQMTNTGASDYGLFTNAPTKFWVRPSMLPPAGALQNGMGQPFWDIAPAAGYTVAGYTNYLAEVFVSDTLSSQVSDPRVNKYKASWVPNLPRTFGAKNHNWTASVAADPPQDREGGVVSDASFRVPPPSGYPSNSQGVVQSVAELGYIPSGIAANVPWRTLRFQPTPGSSRLPDWVLADVFTAPYFPTNNSELYTPRASAVAGRVNLNTRLQPFDTNGRSLPILALFKDATNDSSFSETLVSTAVDNIMSRTYVSGGQNLGGTNGFVSVGELAEIAGLADAGESSERRLQGVLDLATVQGNVFRVYSVGQSLQQTPSGKLVSQAEKMVVAIVERLSDGTLRTLYWRVVPI